jgi:subtilisin family serine protease
MLGDSTKLPPGLTVEKRPGSFLLGNRLVLARKGRGESLAAAIKRFNGMAEVEYAEYNVIYKSSLIPNDVGFSSLWGMTKIQAPQAWDLFTGNASNAGLVCGIDTGVDMSHPDLGANMVRSFSAITGAAITTDDNGHGTHTMGTVMGVGNNGIGVTGVNWQGRGVACKFLTATGSGSSANAVICLDWYVDLSGLSFSLSRFLNHYFPFRFDQVHPTGSENQH